MDTSDVSCNLLVTRLVTGSCPMWFIYRESIGGMWFLRTLFTCYLYAWLFLRLYGALWLKIIGSIVLALFFPHGYYLQFNYMIIFFWLGFVMKRYDSLLKTHRGGGICYFNRCLYTCTLAWTGSVDLRCFA